MSREQAICWWPTRAWTQVARLPLLELSSVTLPFVPEHPDPELPVGEDRSGRWVFLGGLAMLVVFGLIAVFPDVGHPSASSRAKNLSPTAASFLFAALPLGGLLLMVSSFPRTHRFGVDQRGLWWRAGRRSDLIAWEEL